MNTINQLADQPKSKIKIFDSIITWFLAKTSHLQLHHQPKDSTRSMKQKFDRSINQLMSRNQRLKYLIQQSLGSSPRLRISHSITSLKVAQGRWNKNFNDQSTSWSSEIKNLSNHKVFDHHLTEQSINPSPSLETFDKSSDHLINQPETNDLSFSLDTKWNMNQGRESTTLFHRTSKLSPYPSINQSIIKSNTTEN